MRLMKHLIKFIFVSSLALLNVAAPALADTATEMELEARRGLRDLYASTPAALALSKTAKGVLVFPSITKGGFIVGGQYGDGVLFENNEVKGFYNTAAASFGLQAGIQKFGYALFLMSDSDLKYLRNSEGWEIGVGPTITIVDVGMANSLTTTTARSGVYAFFFEQRGLMAGLGLQGSKITKIKPEA